MLYFFTGNSDFLIRYQVKAWKDNFISKFGDFNLIHIKNIDILDNNFLIENITSTSFLSEKKLVIIDIDKELSSEKEEFILKILDKIPDDNIVLFNSINPDKRTKIYKKLKKEAEFKEFNTKNDNDIYSIISNKYGKKISTEGKNTIIRYKSGNLTKIISEIDKLLITFDYIDSNKIIENIAPELEESIFQVIDNILNKQTNNAIKKIDIILNDTNVYGFYNNLLANLRTSVYILKLKNLNKSVSEIGSSLNLGNRTFLITKNYKISCNEAEKLYINLVKIDKKMKSGMLNGTEEKDFIFELERVLLS
ncbi:MAG: hypothetical protein QM490_05955 [Candidatus Gracilibacteria bacterium]